jgi:hypothetical protein
MELDLVFEPGSKDIMPKIRPHDLNLKNWAQTHTRRVYQKILNIKTNRGWMFSYKEKNTWPTLV